MDEIVASIGRVTSVVTGISQESTNQSTRIAALGRATQIVDAATQQNAELVGEAAAAAQRMSDEARNLTRSVEIFKLENGAPPQAETARPRSRSAA